jgi:hypothetical protein
MRGGLTLSLAVNCNRIGRVNAQSANGVHSITKAPRWTKRQDRVESISEQELRQVLIDQVQTGRLVTYKELADLLGLVPPLTIHRVTVALEKLIEEDVIAGRPILAAFAVSKVAPHLPGRGFFVMAQALEVFPGDPSGPEAAAFHALEVQRVLSFYKR